MVTQPPLDWRIAIVDSNGRPTPEFLRRWADMRTINGTIPDLSTGAAVSAYLDKIANTANSTLLRGSAVWGGLTAPADATKFLNGANPMAFAQVKDSDLSTSDITTNNVSITKHGFVPKAPNDATKFLDGTGAWNAPAGGGGGAMTLIGSVTTSSSAASVDFASIPATYKDLILTMQGRGDRAATTTGITVIFNADSAAHYAQHDIVGTTSVSATYSTAQTNARLGTLPAGSATANYAGQIEAQIANYAGTVFYKTFLSRGCYFYGTSSTNAADEIYSGLWLSTAAINEITVAPGVGNFVDGTVVSLYGRK